MTRTVGGTELDGVLAAEERLVLLAFLTEGCEPCREIRSQLDALAEAHGEACAVLAVDADRDRDTVARYAVTSFPTLLFLKRGVELRRVRGGALPPSTLALLSGGGAA